MNLYGIELYTPTGELLADISDLCVTRTYRVRRNRPEDIYLTLNLVKAQQRAEDLGLAFYQLYAPGITEVRIRRGNRYLVGGQLAYAFPRLNRENATLELRAVGFLELWSKRYIVGALQNHSFTSEDIGDVAWQLIQGQQAILGGGGWDFGITQGTIQPSRTITETFTPNAQSIKEILIGLTERHNGIDIEFTPEKVFNVYYPGIGTDKTELVFSYPGNISNIGFPRDATNLANQVITRGQGNGTGQPIAVSEDYSLQTTYKVRQRIDDYPSVIEVPTLQEKADEVLRLYGNPMTIPEVTLNGSDEPFLGSYWIGDRVRFSVDKDVWPAFALLDSQVWKIDEITCVVDENDHEDISLKVGY